jgi:hypothetical protein
VGLQYESLSIFLYSGSVAGTLSFNHGPLKETYILHFEGGASRTKVETTDEGIKQGLRDSMLFEEIQ